jgi:hypothetical protein
METLSPLTGFFMDGVYPRPHFLVAAGDEPPLYV